MSISRFEEFEARIGDQVEIVGYGDDRGLVNITLEDISTGEVLLSIDPGERVFVEEDDDE